MREQVIQKIETERLIAIIRGAAPAQCLKIAEALYAGGIRLMEITYNQKDPASFQDTANAIAAIGEAYGGNMLVGAGTVTTAELVELTARAKGKFIISLDVNIDVIHRNRELGKVYIPGALTPTEILTAHHAGADLVKLFPAASLGVDFVKAVKAPISHVKLMAVGGINETNVGSFLKAGMCGAGVGGTLTNKEWIEAGEYGRVAEAAQKLVNAVKAA